MVFDNDTYSCVDYDTTTHEAIEVYDGILQNLALNVISWLILLGLFTILRKRAGNYGRIALIQKPEDHLEWMELFFGQTDEVAAAPAVTTAYQSISSGSVESFTYDKGVFSWIGAIFRLKREEIVRKCGADAGQYLSFQRHIIVIMFIMMCTSLCVVLPANFQGELEGDENTFGHTTLSNLEPGSLLLWIHVTLSILYLPLAVVVMRRFSISAKIKDSKHLSSKTLIITRIPRKRCNLKDLMQHFSEAYPGLPVRNITLAYDAAETINLDRDRAKSLLARDYAVKYCEMTGERLDLRPYRCAYVCCSCGLCFSPKVDAIDYYLMEAEKLRKRRDEARQAARNRPLGIAFVTMETEEHALELLLDLKRSWHCGTAPGASSVATLLKVQKWRAEYAPETSDILWENLSPSKNWYLRAISINLVLFVILFFLTTPAIIVNLVSTPIFANVVNSTLSPVISQFLPTLMLRTVAALLPVLVSYSDQWLSHWTTTEKNYSVMVKTFSFLLFMVLILPSIGLTSAKAFIDWTFNLHNETFRWKCLFLPDKGAFFVNYIVTSTFIGTALELIRFPELFFYVFNLLLMRSRAEIASVRSEVLKEFPFGVQYAWMLLVFAMTTVYSIQCPLITPFGLMYMIIKHGVDKHNLYFVYSPSKISSQIHGVAINCVMFSVVLVQVCFLALSLLRSGPTSAISAYALTGFVLTILVFLINVFFSCCKGFSPISYERREEEEASPSRAATSSWFVPDILDEMEPEESGDDGGSGDTGDTGDRGPSVSFAQPAGVLYQHTEVVQG